ncbi:MAG: hypothetical protein M3130_11355 [Actinomycetota bacterium]|nr:hypothetical protein [Actinomycetota bacterium]
MTDERVVLVPADRVERWCANFADRHGVTAYDVRQGQLYGLADNGSTALAELPFDRAYDGPPDPASFVNAAVPPPAWGMLLVRKGGFAVARLQGDRIVESKVGQRHVQGRTKAGGQSQQRFARRRDNQARQAYEAAADHAARILGQVPVLVTGGDRSGVSEVLGDARISSLRVVSPWLDVPDPRRAVLERAIADACFVRIVVTNA